MTVVYWPLNIGYYMFWIYIYGSFCPLNKAAKLNSRASIFLFSFYVVLFILAFNWLYSRNTEIFCHACPKTFNPRASDVISVLGEKWKQFSCVRVSQGNSLCNIISSRITNHTFFNDTFFLVFGILRHRNSVNCVNTTAFDI